MIFGTEELQHQYHQSPALLQAVCQILEAHLAQYGVQLELVDCDKQAGCWIAAVTISEYMYEEALLDAVARTNLQFIRSDDLLTCEIENMEMGLITVRVTDTTDLTMLN